MELAIHANEEEMISFLRNKGYEIKREKRTVYVPCYHNDADEAEIDVWAIYKNDKPFAQSYPDSLKVVFEMEVRNKIKELVFS